MTDIQPTGMFKYVFIPAVESEPISSCEADKSGGLSNDFLAKNAKQYFFEKNGGAARASALENATPEEKKLVAKQIRDMYASPSSSSGGGATGGAGSQLAQMNDDDLIDVVKTSEASATCEITALTVPTPTNNYQCVSMYGDDQGRTRNLPFNVRATAVMKACGHGLPPATSNEDGKQSGIYGDVFVGKCKDNEMADIWERVDLNVEEVEGDLDEVEWCRIARKKGGGGGRGGGAAAASLSGLMGNALKGGNGGGMAGGAVPMGGGGGGGGEMSENGYKWSQTDDEVEIKLAVAPGTKAKYVKVKFGRKTLKVTVAGQTLCEGETWSDVVIDDCTYTIQDDSESATGGRELCVTLGKKVAEQWNYAVMRK